jgi:hypothetical protein
MAMLTGNSTAEVDAPLERVWAGELKRAIVSS